MLKPDYIIARVEIDIWNENKLHEKQNPSKSERGCSALADENVVTDAFRPEMCLVNTPGGEAGEEVSAFLPE